MPILMTMYRLFSRRGRSGPKNGIQHLTSSTTILTVFADGARRGYGVPTVSDQLPCPLMNAMPVKRDKSLVRMKISITLGLHLRRARGS